MAYHGEDEVPERLLHDLAHTPVVPLHEIEAHARFGPRRDRLSPRETEVLRCASYGLDYRMTADVLGISAETVQTHLKRIRYGLAAKNTTHAVALGIRLGLI